MSTELNVIKEDVVDVITVKIKEFKENKTLNIPDNYSIDNALKSAWLTLQETTDKNKKKALEVCTKNSIANALLDMVIQGLSPAKKQCYFIVRGNKLCLDSSYFGSMAVAKRLNEVIDIASNVIYEGDNFVYEIDNETGKKKIIKHEQKLENIDNNKILGVYTLIKTKNSMGDHLEIMNMDQVRAAWNMGTGYGKSPAHKNFPDQMALKTVINRAVKYYVNTSDDSDILVGAYNRTLESGFDNTNKQIDTEANTGKPITFDTVDEDVEEGDLTDEEKMEILAAEAEYERDF